MSFVLAGLLLAAPVEPAGFTGAWALSSEARGFEATLAAWCRGFPALLRGLACDAVARRVQPYPRVALEFTETVERFTLGPWGPVELVLGEKPAPRRNERDEVVASSAWVDGAHLRHRFAHGAGVRFEVFELLGPDTLVVRTTVESPHFPSPLRFEATYRRVERSRPGL
ncbi:MAG: hypothetical protein MUC96_08720 [Myxococcaceae bacterium]|jgi:hypothetical protein|nr:hypothetical protein [Myxococcaceae bacterium]